MINDRFKLRVWDKTYNEYVFCHVVCVDKEAIWCGCREYGDLRLTCYDSNMVVIEQCIGVSDRNGKLIYEGDIVYCESANVSGVIIFQNGAFRFSWKKFLPLALDVLSDPNDIKIVGNIHDGVNDK